MSKYDLHDTVLRRLLMSRSWVIYYKQLNVREIAFLHWRRAPALLLKRRKTRLPLQWIVYPFERLLSKETEAHSRWFAVCSSSLSASSCKASHCRCKIRFSNCCYAQHHSCWLCIFAVKYNGVKGHLSTLSVTASGHTAVIIYPLCIWRNPALLIF